MLKNPQYKASNPRLAKFLAFIQSEYHDWQEYKKNILEKEKYQVKQFMQTKPILTILSDILTFCNLDTISFMNRFCINFSIKDLLNIVDKKTHESLILTIFANDEAFTILQQILGYTAQEIIDLLKQYWLALTKMDSSTDLDAIVNHIRILKKSIKK